MLWMTAGLAVLTLVLFAPIVLPLLRHAGAQNEATETALADRMLMLHQIVWPLLGSFFLLSGLVSLLMTHRIAGPLYRFRRVFADIGRGTLSMHVTLRDGDYLTDEAAELDAMVAALRARVTRAKEAIAVVHDEAMRVSEQYESSEHIAALVRSVEVAEAVLAEFATVSAHVTPATSSAKVSGTTDVRPTASPARGFTIIELLLVVAIIGIIAAIAIPSYSRALNAARTTRAIADIRSIDRMARLHELSNGCLPSSLADIQFDKNRDPWGQPYVYEPIKPVGNKSSCGACTDVCISQSQARKDKSLHPVNSDFDCYSVGPDGKSNSALTSGPSQDDIIRGGNGSFFGLGSDF